MDQVKKKKIIEELGNEKSLYLPVERILEQVETFERGIPFVKLNRPCMVGDGLKVVPKEEHQHYIDLYNEAVKNISIIKFVPASGAATRMFKKQHAVLVSDKKIDFDELVNKANSGDEDSKAALLFLDNIEKFAFYDDLKEALTKDGKNSRVKENISDLLSYTLSDPGLNYSNLPKGCIKFHFYEDGSRTAFEEHLVEALNYSKNKSCVAQVHFTISPEHSEKVKSIINSVLEKFLKKGEEVQVSYSYQKPSTNTIAVDINNYPFRDSKGKLLFRPAGHGALLENLNDIDADIIIIKNIDNVVQDHFKEETYNHKKILTGYLYGLQKKIHTYLSRLENHEIDGDLLDEILIFIKSELEMEVDAGFKLMSNPDKRKHFFELLNRPVRVCGMVKKEKHSGGGPFWIYEGDEKIVKQVVETTQIDLNDEDQEAIFNSARYFSPVDFICGVKDYKDAKFNLLNFSNPDTGFISTKSKDGKELKALELPGLWNGGMYDWISVFIEVPKITFSPVKEVNDLLKPEHQPKD